MRVNEGRPSIAVEVPLQALDLAVVRDMKGLTLYPGFIEYYGHSSGSSNTAALHKYLPISDEQISWQQKAGFDVVARYLDKRLNGPECARERIAAE